MRFIRFINYFFRRILDLEKEAKKLQEEKEQLKKEKEKENLRHQQKSDLFSAISHEIATPLTSLQETLSLLFDESLGKTTQEQKKFLAIASQSVGRLSRLIGDFLDISRIEAGVIRATPQPLNIAILAKGVVKTMLPSAEKKGIELSSRIPFHLSLVMADHDRTIQVLTNLISNSIKYTPRGKVELTAEEKNDFLEVGVVDTGIGIPAEEKEKIFDHFYQIKQYRSDGSSGRGLGLSIIKAIVECQGGKIWVESKLDKGSKFTFTIPIVSPSSFQDILDEAIRFGDEKGKTFTLFLLKAEKFEEIEQGEEFKKELELLLKEMMRHSIDPVGIYQDKIGIVIWHLPEEKIEPFISRLKSTIKEHKFFSLPAPLKLSYRIAWVHFPEEGRNKEALIKKIEEQLKDKRGILLIEGIKNGEDFNCR